MSNKKKEIFEVLSSIDCSEKIEKKNNLSYLSWAWAWAIVKTHYPSTNYKVIMFDGKPYIEDEVLGYMVFTEVTIDGETIGMQLPVMDGANKSQKRSSYEYETKFAVKKVEAATMFDVNTALMRCLTKNLAMFGLGHYIYAGEDLPVIVETEEMKHTKQIEADAAILKQANTFTNFDLYKDWYKANLNNVTDSSVKNELAAIGKKLKEQQEEINNK